MTFAVDPTKPCKDVASSYASGSASSSAFATMHFRNIGGSTKMVDSDLSTTLASNAVRAAGSSACSTPDLSTALSTRCSTCCQKRRDSGVGKKIQSSGANSAAAQTTRNQD